MELDGDDDEKESSNTTTTQNHSRKHGREDGINGLSSGGEKSGVPEKKRRRKTAASLTPVASTSQPDGAKGDEVAVDSIAGSSPPVEEVRPVTNGCSVGIQVETTVVIPPKDAVILSSEHNRASVAWNPVNPTSLATATSGSLPRIWTVPHEPDGLQPYASRALDHVDIQQPEKVTAVEWSPKGDVLATASLDGTTHLWSVEGILLHTLDLRRVPILSLKWNSSAKFLIVFHCDEHLVLWNAATGDVVLDFERTNDSIYDVTWISDKWFACAKAEGAVTWDAETGRPMRLCVEVDERAHTLAWDEIGKRLAVGTTGGKIAVSCSPIML